MPLEHLNLHHILEDYQFGFHSYETQLMIITVVEDILAAMDQRCRVDVMLLDFSKAFDTVPHQRLLKKLHNNGIRSNILKWINIWLMQRLQQVVIDGQEPKFVPVKSGVPQGTVLGPLMFLVYYYNDISGGISSNVRLFADGCILYCIIKEKHDQDVLQANINQLIKWSEIWQMTFNARKCAVLRCSQLLTMLLAMSLMLSQPSLFALTSCIYCITIYSSKIPIL